MRTGNLCSEAVLVPACVLVIVLILISMWCWVSERLSEPCETPFQETNAHSPALEIFNLFLLSAQTPGKILMS